MPKFAEYTTYLLEKNRGKKAHGEKWKAIYRFSQMPVDYWDLKDNELVNIARAVNYDVGYTEMIVKIDQHLGGKGLQGFEGYRETRTHTQRKTVCLSELSYNPMLDTVKIKRLALIDDFFFAFRDDYLLDNGKEWEPKPVVEKGFMATLLNPASIFMKLLSLKESAYGLQIPSEVYTSHEERCKDSGSYGPVPSGIYDRRTYSVEENKREREEQF